MKKTRVAMALTGATFAIFGISAPAMAESDINWTWNSDDHDARARFAAEGEHFYGQELDGSTYVHWAAGSQVSNWWIPGDEDGNLWSLNEGFAEGTKVTMRVCQYHDNYPDDCSGTKSGVA